MAGLLAGFLASGAARQYATAKNAEVDTHNKAAMMVINQEMQNDFRERMAERQIAADKGRIELQHELGKESEGIQHGHRKELKAIEEEGALKRTQLQNEGLLNRTKYSSDRADARQQRSHEFQTKNRGLLNTGASSGFSAKELHKGLEADMKSILELRKKLYDPMMSNSAEYKGFVEEEIKRLTHGADRKRAALIDMGQNNDADFFKSQFAPKTDNQDSGTKPLLDISSSPSHTETLPTKTRAPIHTEKTETAQSSFPRDLTSLENELKQLPGNDSSGRRNELQSAFNSLRPKIEQLRLVESKIRNLPSNVEQGRRVELNSIRMQLEQEIQAELATHV